MPMVKALLAASLALAVLVLPTGAGAQAPQYVPSDENPEDFPAGPGRDDTFYACTACHGFKLIAQQGMNRRQWEESLQWMTEKHGMPPLPEKEQKVVLDYLEATYPPRAPTASPGWRNPFAPQ
jgi:hypothetical protein